MIHTEYSCVLRLADAFSKKCLLSNGEHIDTYTHVTNITCHLDVYRYHEDSDMKTALS